MSKNRSGISVSTHEDGRFAVENMADEADGLYGTTTIVTTAFLGSMLRVYDKFRAYGPNWSFLSLALGVLPLTGMLVRLCLMPGINVTSWQAYLDSLKLDDGAGPTRMMDLEVRNRCMTAIALVVLAMYRPGNISAVACRAIESEGAARSRNQGVLHKASHGRVGGGKV